MRSSMIVFLAAVAGTSVLGAPRAGATPEPRPIHAVFRREVVNLETFSGYLFPKPSPLLRNAPEAREGTWFGQIYRQLPGDDPNVKEHNVPFAVRFEQGNVVRAWCDVNLNGDLTDDPLPALSAFPGERPGRSFIADLRWSARVKGRDLAIERMVRVVIFAPENPSFPPRYHTQDVYGMLGTVELDGVRRLAVLYDTNGDGLYTKGNSDGMFFDLDGDRHFDIDLMGPAFGAFAVPFSVANRDYVVESIDPTGAELTLRPGGASVPAIAPMMGVTAPDFSYMDVRGRPVHLAALKGRAAVVYFWSSICGGCRRHADELRALYERYDRSQLEILGVSYDFDRVAMEQFRAEHGHTWPTSFTGGFPAQDPIGRLYQEAGSGVFYVVAPDGRLVAKDYDIETLTADLEKILGSNHRTLGSTP